MSTHFGPYTISHVERLVGDFTGVWMKPFDSAVVRGPNGERPLTSVGCIWPCGCETRGAAYDIIRSSRWKPCLKHRYLAVGEPVSDVPEEQRGGVLVSRADATRRDDVMLFERIAEYSK